jgi:hypothetical protein
MRKTLLFLLLLCTKLAFGQLRDNFDDGNFTVNPAWKGQSSQFNITNDKKLKTSLSAVSQAVSMCTENVLALNVKWEFSVQLNFDPSTTNLTRIYLIADKEELNGSLKGYFMQIGESGSVDSYDLYKQSGNSITKIIDCPAKNRVNINYLSTKIRVTRDDFGKWEVYSVMGEGSKYTLDGSVIDRTFDRTNWFGVYCKYTASRSEGFSFDDFSVEELAPDLIRPKLLTINVVDEFELEATFSEALVLNSALSMSNYVIKDTQESPILVETTNAPNVFRLHFDKAFESKKYTLSVYNLLDLKGNKILEDNEVSTFFIKPYIAVKGDVVINEIFADPSPTAGMPEEEFVEIWNTTNRYIILTGWKYSDLTSTVAFSADTLKPNELLILTAKTNINHFSRFGRVIGFSSWPSLNNDKDKLSLISDQNKVIDEVFYTQQWYKDVTKSQGGYSLELIDPKNRCMGTQNWQASKYVIGGTPGIENSVYRDQIITTALMVVSTVVINETTLRVDFNRSVDSLSGSLQNNYRLNNGIGPPITALLQSPNFSSVVLQWAAPFNRGVEHTLSIEQVTDCAGNVIVQNSKELKIFLAKGVLIGDILISEILVNPKADGVDFIEVYNHTNEIKDLATLKLATVDENGNIFNAKTISSLPIHIPAKTYWLLATDNSIIKQQYEVKNPTNFTKMTTMPAYRNDRGVVILLGDKGVIDRFDYRENMHFPLLQIVKGVSLERASFQRPTNEKGNFKSAAQAIGFATPTYENSQEESQSISNAVWLSRKVFSPDGDGFEDELQINYKFAIHEYLANVTIFNEFGIAVKRLARNSNLGQAGSFVWNGLNDRGGSNGIGIYIVKFDVFSLTGKMRHFERVCVLASKLD